MGLFIISWILEKKFFRVGCSVNVIVKDVMFNDVIIGVIDIFILFKIINMVRVVNIVFNVLFVIVLVFFINVDCFW